MGIHILYTVGNRDIQLPGCDISRNFRDQTLQITERLRALSPGQERDSFISSLSTPILDASLKYILRCHPRVDSLIFFVTNQQSPHQRDTIHAALILKALVEESARYKDKDGKVKVVSVRHREVKGINPSLYDEAYNWFREKFTGIDGDPQPEAVYVCPTAGTPQLSLGLIIRSIALFRERCEVIAVPMGADVGVPISLGEDLMKEFRLERVRQALKTGDYGALIQILEGMKGAEIVQGVARYAFRRFNFDFETARSELDSPIRISRGKERQELQAMQRSLEPLIADTQVPDGERAPALLGELLHNLRVIWEAERYVDFLGRLFRLQEATVRYLLEKHLGFPTDERKDRSTFIAKVKADRALLGYLEQQQAAPGVPLNYESMSIPAFLAVLCYHAKNNIGPAFLRQAHDYLAGLDKLQRLRNRSIIAHGFQGVSLQGIQEAYQQGDLLHNMENLLTLIQIPLGPDPFAEACNFMEACLGRL